MMKKIYAAMGVFILISLLSPNQVNGETQSSCIFEMVPEVPNYNTSKITVTAKNISPDNKGPFYFESSCGSFVGRKKGVQTTVNGSYLEATYDYIKGPQSCEFSVDARSSHRINFLDNNTPICWKDYKVAPYKCTLTLALSDKDVTNKQVRWNERLGTLKASVDQKFILGRGGIFSLKTPLGGPNNSINDSFDLTKNVPIGDYIVNYVERDSVTSWVISECSAKFYVLQAGQTPLPGSQPGTAGPTCDKCGLCTDQSGNKTEPPDHDKCMLCFEKGTDANYGKGSWSALGCIPTDPQKFIQWLLNNAINIVGGLAFLMILFGSFRVATSAGNPEALNEGKDIIFAALAGLLFIVFSVILLKIIGHDILQIPGFQ